LSVSNRIIRRVSGPAGEGDWPLSYDQERLWFLYFLDPESTANNMVSAVRLRGPLHVPALTRTLTEIVRRHGAWRTTFPLVDGRPVQRVIAEPRISLPLVDFTALPAELREPAALGLLNDDTQLPFSLEEGPLLRMVLVRMGDRVHFCWLSIHHIVNDWVSFQGFWRELAVLYDAFSSDRPARLPELPAQYSDFSVWQREWMAGEVLNDACGWLGWCLWTTSIGGSSCSWASPASSTCRRTGRGRRAAPPGAAASRCGWTAASPAGCGRWRSARARPASWW
jgi:hypothetical protein